MSRSVNHVLRASDWIILLAGVAVILAVAAFWLDRIGGLK